jgi:limonene 1,2-monooxygenase
MGTTLVGSPETVIKGINRLLEFSQGGFGGILFRAHEWANREQTLRSYELFARQVMPHFQGSLGPIIGSNAWARENRRQVFGSTPEAVRRAFTDFGHAVPEEYRSRTIGARDTDLSS